MAEPFLAEIRFFSFNFAPKGWAMCDGQLLPINQNQALFALLGTTYGGDGRNNFALPNLRGRMPVHRGSGYSLGQAAGAATHTLTAAEMPAHTHLVITSTTEANTPNPVGGGFVPVGQSIFSDLPNTTMSASAITSVGGSQPHPNLPPSLVLNFCIALQGIFPSQN